MLATPDADLRDPDAIFGHPDLRNLIDFDQPIGLLMLAALHFISDEDDPWGLVSRYRSYLPVGSHIASARYPQSRDPGPCPERAD